MPFTRCHLMAALALLLVSGQIVSAGTRRLWDFAPYSSLRRSPAEQGAPPNSQPLQVAPEALARLLGAVRFREEGRDLPLFAPEELPALTVALSEALALAQPGEDLDLLSHFKRDGTFLAHARAVTGKLFVQGGQLNLLVKEPRLDYLILLNLETRLPTVAYGSRTTPGAATLKAPGAEVRRADWLVLPLAAPEPGSPGTSAGTVEDRLRELKRFHDSGLITDSDYARQKEEVFKAFQKGGNGGVPPSP